jgi:hypothetical protein
VKQIPYYLDNSIENDVVYQYGIVTKGYQTDNSVSAVVWQSFSDENKPATGKGVVTTRTKVDLPTFPAATFTKIQTSHPGNAIPDNAADTPDEILVEVTGLLPGYDYQFFLQSVNLASPNEVDWDYNYNFSSSYNLLRDTWAQNKLDGTNEPYRVTVKKSDIQSRLSPPSNLNGDTYTPASFTNYKIRCAVTISLPSSEPNKYFETTGPKNSGPIAEQTRFASDTKTISASNLTF